VIGSFVVVIGASLLIAVTAFAFTGTAFHGEFTNAEGVARGLEQTLGRTAGVLFALVLLNASIIGAGAVTLSTSYAFGDVFGLRHSLHRPPSEAKFFYGSFAVIVVCACAIVLSPGAPLGVITVGVQALAGVLLPSASVFLLLLCNDRAVLGPWVNKPWLNALATVIVGVLLMLSTILVATTVFPDVNVTLLLGGLSLVLVLGCLVFGVVSWRGRARARAVTPEDPAEAARRAYAEAVAAATARRREMLAAAAVARSRAEAAAREGYEAALAEAMNDPVARAAAKADEDQTLANTAADYALAEAAGAGEYKRAVAAAKAERDKALAAARAEARSWTMPPLALLAKPEWSRGRVLAMYTLRAYLVVAVVLLIVKASRLAGG
jgi:hypothetical protein